MKDENSFLNYNTKLFNSHIIKTYNKVLDTHIEY